MKRYPWCKDCDWHKGECPHRPWYASLTRLCGSSGPIALLLKCIPAALVVTALLVLLFAGCYALEIPAPIAGILGALFVILLLPVARWIVNRTKVADRS